MLWLYAMGLWRAVGCRMIVARCHPAKDIQEQEMTLTASTASEPVKNPHPRLQVPTATSTSITPRGKHPHSPLARTPTHLPKRKLSAIEFWTSIASGNCLSFCEVNVKPFCSWCCVYNYLIILLFVFCSNFYWVFSLLFVLSFFFLNICTCFTCISLLIAWIGHLCWL